MSQVKTIFIQSGESYFATAGERLQTTLGSCVSVWIHDRKLRIEGMIHYLLPSQPSPTSDENPLKYGNQAILFLLRVFKLAGSEPQNLEVSILGGLINQPGSPVATAAAGDISHANVEAARKILRRFNFPPPRKQLVNVEGKSLQVRFDSHSGRIDVKIYKPGRGLLAIGASTGGTEALRTILHQLSPTCPPIVIVQHMPAEFTKPFAESLNHSSHVKVKKAERGDVLVSGHAYLAPGGRQMRVDETDESR